MLRGFAGAVKEIRVIDWSQEPFFGACYSFPAPGSMTTIMPILRNGLGHVHFAGEHCSAAFVGYMEGALESGLRVAETIVNPKVARAA